MRIVIVKIQQPKTGQTTRHASAAQSHRRDDQWVIDDDEKRGVEDDEQCTTTTTTRTNVTTPPPRAGEHNNGDGDSTPQLVQLGHGGVDRLGHTRRFRPRLLQYLPLALLHQ